LGRLDTLLVLQQAAPSEQPSAEAVPVPCTPPRQQHATEQLPASPAAASGQQDSIGEGEEQVEVKLEEGEDGQVSFKLTLTPTKLASAAAAEAAAQAADPGHMPASPAASSASRPIRRSESMAPRPGALHDGAARGEHHRC
jgi:hypothetical protein